MPGIVTALLPGVASTEYPGFISYGETPSFVAPMGVSPDFTLGDSAHASRAGAIRLAHSGDTNPHGLKIPGGAFPTGNTAFCIEAYVKITASTWGVFFSTAGSNTGGNATFAWDYATSKWGVWLYDGSRPFALAGNTTAINTWHHVALVRNNSDTFRVFVDGVLEAEMTYTISLTAGAPILGYNPSFSPQSCTALFHDFRITLGDSRYWENFTPPEPFAVTEPDFFVSKSNPLYTAPGDGLPAFSGWKKSGRMYLNSSQKSIGLGRIAGTVKEKATPTNLPLARRVALLRHYDDFKVAEGWSSAAGDYVFENIDHRIKYYVVSFDHTGTYRAVIADNLIPTVS